MSFFGVIVKEKCVEAFAHLFLLFCKPCAKLKASKEKDNPILVKNLNEEECYYEKNIFLYAYDVCFF